MAAAEASGRQQATIGQHQDNSPWKQRAAARLQKLVFYSINSNLQHYRVRAPITRTVTGSSMSRRDLSCVEFWARAGVTLDLRLAIATPCRFLYDPWGGVLYEYRTGMSVNFANFRLFIRIGVLK